MFFGNTIGIYLQLSRQKDDMLKIGFDELFGSDLVSWCLGTVWDNLF